MTLPRLSSGLTSAVVEARKAWPFRAVSALLEPVYYFFDATSPDGTPSNSKIVYTLAAIGSLFSVLNMGLAIAARIRTTPGADVPMGFTIYASAVFLFCGSFDSFKRWTNRLAGGGNTTTTTDSESHSTVTKEIS